MPPTGSLKRKRSSASNLPVSMEQTIVTVTVGPNGTPFNFHRGLLCRCSGFFRGAFKGSFKEAGDRSVHLDDVSVLTMQQFMQWIYNSAFLTGPATIASFNGPSHELLTPDEMLDLYVFADRYEIVTLRNDIVYALRVVMYNVQTGSYGKDLPLAFVERAYERLPHTSTLCKWLRWHMSVMWAPDLMDEDVEKYAYLPASFLLGVAVHCRMRIEWAEDKEVSAHDESLVAVEQFRLGCEFHEHEQAGVCPGKGVPESDVSKLNFTWLMKSKLSLQ
ncbi:hypothetical protein BU16DRAFT_523640 [Lophium mytilinum]|uniref:BTB domain-containing protein n=1 Tax=Lophium mytilinum TaxID=390894 RepID=A0A6A6R3Y6_9PEZI|nr:hypothetical protein BU16DRAFT_523640 [Lophium mytilinum]